MAAGSQRGQSPRIDIALLSDVMGSVTRAGRVLGFGWKDLRTEAQGPAHELPPDIEALVVQFSIEHDIWGAVRLSNELRRVGVVVSPVEVRNVWALHGLRARAQRARAATRSQAAWSSMLDAETARKARRQLPRRELMWMALFMAATVSMAIWALQWLY